MQQRGQMYTNTKKHSEKVQGSVDVKVDRYE